MFRVNIDLDYSWGVDPIRFVLEDADISPSLMERWELHWADQSLANQERRTRVIKKQLEEFHAWMLRILKEVPSLLHELRLLQETVAYKKGEKDGLAGYQIEADERQEQERLRRLQDAKDKLALKEGRRRWNSQAQGHGPLPQGHGPMPNQGPGPANVPPLGPAPVAAPFPDFQQVLQQEMSKFMSQLSGSAPFSPIQPTPPQTAFTNPTLTPKHPLSFISQPCPAAAAAFVPYQPADVFPGAILEKKEKSPKRPVPDSDDDDGESLGDEGGEQDRRDKEMTEAGNRKDERKTKSGNLYLLRNDGHPDKRCKNRVVVQDELDDPVDGMAVDQSYEDAAAKRQQEHALIIEEMEQKKAQVQREHDLQEQALFHEAKAKLLNMQLEQAKPTPPPTPLPTPPPTPKGVLAKLKDYLP